MSRRCAVFFYLVTPIIHFQCFTMALNETVKLRLSFFPPQTESRGAQTFIVHSQECAWTVRGSSSAARLQKRIIGRLSQVFLLHCLHTRRLTWDCLLAFALMSIFPSIYKRRLGLCVGDAENLKLVVSLGERILKCEINWQKNLWEIPRITNINVQNKPAQIWWAQNSVILSLI